MIDSVRISIASFSLSLKSGSWENVFLSSFCLISLSLFPHGYYRGHCAQAVHPVVELDGFLIDNVFGRSAPGLAFLPC